MSNVTDPPDVTPAPVIPAGKARETLLLATANLSTALENYTRTAEAIARALDEQDAAVRQAHDVLTGTVLP